MDFPQPTKTKLRSFTINGFDVKFFVKSLNVHETVCKPYLTAQVVIDDMDNIINKLKLVGGEEVYFSFYGNEFRSYSAKLNVLKISDATQALNLRHMIYTIELIGKAYFNDRVNLVQQAFKGLTGTDAIQKLHGQYVGGDAPLSILASSFGLLTKNNAYTVKATKPFKAIDDIRKTLNFAQYKTGNNLYYRDRDQYVLAPLEQLFSQLSPQESFIQKSTWGATLSDYALAYRAIMEAKLDVHGNPSGIGELASVANQAKTVFDLNLMRVVNKKFPTQISPGKVVGNALVNLIGSILQGKTNGGEPNYHVMDSDQRSKETDTSEKTERERLYAATAKAGPRLNIKVPIQGGVNCTVGKGIYATLQPPIGDADLSNLSPNYYKGNWLVIDLTHSLKLDSSTLYNGTTMLKCIRGGIG
jgi:hypothetical protein